jgi:hypothetical protein
MNPNKTLWAKGDFTRIAESMRESGEALVKSLGIHQGLRNQLLLKEVATAGVLENR